MRIKLSEELKDEIKQLTHKEKDRLLLRLIPKDDLLAEQLTFKLLEFEQTTEERRYQTKEDIEIYFSSTPKFRSIRKLVVHMRKMSAKITRHVRVTKDVYGELELNLFLLLFVNNKFNALIKKDKTDFYKFASYLDQKRKKIETLKEKVGDELIIDFSGALDEFDQMNRKYINE